MANFVLVPGMWLGGWAWRAVAERLREADHAVFPLTLTGLADRSHLAGPGIDLDTHTEDIVRLIEAEELWDVVLVGHSYGGLPVTMAADRIPERLSRVVYVESGPLPDGFTQLSMLAEEEVGATDDLVPPRQWDPEADPLLLAGLDESALTLLRRAATPHPRASVAQPLHRGGPAPAPPRGGPATAPPGPRGSAAGPVPTALVTCTFPLEQVHQMIAAKHPMFAMLPEDAEVVGLPTGHWPMLSEPKRLAGILDQLASAPVLTT